MTFQSFLVTLCETTSHTLTPHHQIGRGFVNPTGVTGHAGVGSGVRQVRGADQKTARLQQSETRQLHRAACQNPLSCAKTEGWRNTREREREMKMTIKQTRRSPAHQNNVDWTLDLADIPKLPLKH